jgi:hypothetical protein
MVSAEGVTVMEGIDVTIGVVTVTVTPDRFTG